MTDVNVRTWCHSTYGTVDIRVVYQLVRGIVLYLHLVSIISHGPKLGHV